MIPLLLARLEEELPGLTDALAGLLGRTPVLELCSCGLALAGLDRRRVEQAVITELMILEVDPVGVLRWTVEEATAV